MSAVAAELTVGQVLAWAKTFLDYTDAVVRDIPEDDAALDWRPTDAAGSWYFSIREQAMHIVDERFDIVRGWIEGADVEAELFLKEYGGVGKAWEFRSASKAEILERLQQGRALVDEFMARPESILLETSPGLIKQYEEALAKLREQGKDTAEREARGPSKIVNIVLFLVAHEQSHRSVLQTMLRQRGHEVTRYA